VFGQAISSTTAVRLRDRHRLLCMMALEQFGLLVGRRVSAWSSCSGWNRFQSAWADWADGRTGTKLGIIFAFFDSRLAEAPAHSGRAFHWRPPLPVCIVLPPRGVAPTALPRLTMKTTPWCSSPSLFAKLAYCEDAKPGSLAPPRLLAQEQACSGSLSLVTPEP